MGFNAGRESCARRGSPTIRVSKKLGHKVVN